MTTSEPAVKGTGKVVAFYLGLVAAVPAASFLAATMLLTDVRSGVRLAAGFLEVLGVLAVGWGFTANRVRYGGGPPILEPLVTPMKRGLGLASPARQEVEDAAVAGAITVPDAKVTIRTGPDSTLEHRIEILEQRVEQLDGLVDAYAAVAKEETVQLREGLRAERAIRRKAIQRVEERLADAATQGMGREVVGFLWVVMGFVAETVATVF